MRRRNRNAFLLALALLFCIGTPAVILLSQGYRFDVARRALVRTGAVHVKTKPTNAAVTIDGKVKKVRSSRILYTGTVFKNVIPGEHSVTVSAPGFLTWEKSVSIEPSLVAKLTRIALPFAAPKIESLFATSSRYRFLGAAQERLFVLNPSKTEIAALPISGGSPVPVFPLPDAPLSPTETIRALLISASGRSISVDTTKTSYALSNNTVLPLKDAIASIARQSNNKTPQLVWHPQDDSILFALTPTNSYWLQVPDLQPQPLLKEKVIGWNKTGARAYFMTRTGTLYEFSTTLQPTSTPLAEIDPTLFARFPLDIHALGDRRFVIHEPSGMLLFIDIPSLHSELIDPAVRFVVVSDDASRMAYLTNDNRLFAYFFEDVIDDSSYQRFEKIALAALAENVQPLALSLTNDNWYLAVATEWGAILSDIDKRPPYHTWIVSFEKKILPLLIEPRTATLVWQEGGAFSSARLLP